MCQADLTLFPLLPTEAYKCQADLTPFPYCLQRRAKCQADLTLFPLLSTEAYMCQADLTLFPLLSTEAYMCQADLTPFPYCLQRRAGVRWCTQGQWRSRGPAWWWRTRSLASRPSTRSRSASSVWNKSTSSTCAWWRAPPL